MEFLPLLEICNVYQPQTIAKKTLTSTGKYPVYGANGIIGYHNAYNHAEEEVVMGCRGSCGAVHISRPQSWINGNAMVIHPNGKYPLTKLYLKYCLLSTNRDKVITGTAQPQITKQSLEGFLIPVCPPPKQEQTVSKIDELFSEIDNAVSSLKIARQKIAAFQQIITENSFAELNEETTLLGNHLLIIESGKSFKCEERPPKSSECGIVKVSAVTWGRFQQQESKTCKPEQFVEKRRIRKGDFLFSRANTIQLIGNCVIVDEIEKKLMLSDKILRFSFDESLLPDFALLYLRSGTAKKQIRSFSSGNQDGMRNISQDKIRKITIPLPPILLQEKIVESVNRKIDACKKLEIQINDALIRAEKLKQSILKKAFEGEL